MTLRDLTVKAELGLSPTQFWTWFGTATLKGDVLMVESDKEGADIERLFGEQLRRVLPALKVIPNPPLAKPRKSSVLKASAPQELRDLFGKKMPL